MSEIDRISAMTPQDLERFCKQLERESKRILRDMDEALGRIRAIVDGETK